MSEEKCYKHKLNMLEPGSIMLKWIGILILIGLVLYIFQLKIVAYGAWILSGIIFVVLLILLTIEGHKDKVMNEIGIKENEKNGEL
ncbi:hypothetical protein [Eubacterium sp.]|uniref:hypothetical protein n=1 Tax=Eubacterium sp. TaxID=142586 RepID=UPI0025D61F03|nr:hypothetical protein [Eubacterium sp.]MCR5628867.1 hypothetical protein [Eubacterium sp.]